MLIMNGQLANLLGFWYQLYDLSGNPVQINYKGQGTQTGDRVILGNPYQDTNLLEYKVSDEPTEESKEWVRGYRHAAKQKRKRYGSTWGEPFRKPLGWH